MASGLSFRKEKLIGVLIFALIIFLFNSHFSTALAGRKITSFSAEQVEISPQGRVVNTSNIYITPDKIKIDGMPGAGGDNSRNISMLILKKQKQQYFINHDKKLYFQTLSDEDQLEQQLRSFKDVQQEKTLGREKISGFKCTKKQITTSFDVMGIKSTHTMLVWQSDRLEIPLKTKTEDGGITELRNIKKGSPSGKHFRLPKGYKKVSNMMEVFGMNFEEMEKEQSEEEQTPEQQDMQNMDMEEMMAAMKKAMGENASPEMMEQMQEALSRARQTETGEEAVSGLWKIVPRRPGDKVTDGIKTPHVINAVMATKASLVQVFSFYENRLKAEGWKSGGKHIQGAEGHMIFMKGQDQLIVATASNPGISGNYKLFYEVKLSGPDL